MSSAGKHSAKKSEYFAKLVSLLTEYKKILIVTADNIGAFHLQSIRKELRGQAVILMGKNTMIRKALRGQLEAHPEWKALIPYVKGNVGFIFTNSDLSEIKKIVDSNRVSAPAKVGTIAPIDVMVPAGPTGMEPTMTGFLQALNITSKINRGQIEILNDVQLITAGDKVGASESQLLQKLNIKPFEYALQFRTVYDDGETYPASVLDLSDDDIVAKFQRGVNLIASVSLAASFPTLASLPHNIARAYKNLLAISLATDYDFPRAKELKDLLNNPEALAAAQAAAAATSAPAATGGAAPKEAAKVEEEEEEESDDDMGFGLFD